MKTICLRLVERKHKGKPSPKRVKNRFMTFISMRLDSGGRDAGEEISTSLF